MENPRRRRPRRPSIEQLEQRMAMTVDLLNELLSSALDQHSIDDIALEQHADLLNGPQAVQHVEQPPDFWYDPSVEQDPLATLDEIEQHLVNAHNLTGLTTARSEYGFTGAGQTVAIIDSGIAWNHYALGGGLGANYRVVGGKDFTEENDSNPYDDGPGGSHGTHVAGIVGANPGSGSNYGVAPGVDLVGLRVFNDQGNGYFSWVEQALQWIHANRNAFEHPITAVNLSLGTDWNATTVPSWSSLENEFAQLKADGIFVSVSAGNAFGSYNTPGLSYPAASPHVVPVMSVDDNGAMSDFSQRHSRAIAAPGRTVMSTVPDYKGNNNGVADDWGSKSGTSMAAPYIAGASALIREAMQFVGYTNITQQTIYNHMLATAVQFYDAATNANYKRIHLGNAIDALIPNDEFGSTVATAHNLGAIGSSQQISGLIGKVNDADYFRFTAATTSTMTFTVSTTHHLDPVWHASGATGQVSGAGGETFTIEVTAGQTYTIGLSSSDGLGYYNLSVSTDNDFTYVNWGSISQSQVNNQAVSGERWYRVQAGRSGYLTVETFFAAAGGNVDISLYNSGLQLLTTATATASGERFDRIAVAGQVYYIRCAGTNADIDFRLTNLIATGGGTVTLEGTAGDDDLTFTAGSTHTVGINGVTYAFDSATWKNFQINGGGGHNTMHMTGTSGDETAVLRTVISELYGADYSVYATNLRDSVIDGGSGYDKMSMFDSTKDDTFTAWHDRAEMAGIGFRTEARDFDWVLAYARGGLDTAMLYDSAGDDTYSTWTHRAVLYGIGFSNDARDFERTLGFASDGTDRAFLRDGGGNDTYTTWEYRACMYGTGFSNDARDFEFTTGYASGGYDRAYFRGSAGDDVYTTWPHMVVMAGPTTRHEGFYFELNEAFESAGADRSYVLGLNSVASLAEPERTGSQSVSHATPVASKVDSFRALDIFAAWRGRLGGQNNDGTFGHSTTVSIGGESTLGLRQPGSSSLASRPTFDSVERITLLEDLLYGPDAGEQRRETPSVDDTSSFYLPRHGDTDDDDEAATKKAVDEALQSVSDWKPTALTSAN